MKTKPARKKPKYERFTDPWFWRQGRTLKMVLNQPDFIRRCGRAARDSLFFGKTILTSSYQHIFMNVKLFLKKMVG